jgi:hypothetical protein
MIKTMRWLLGTVVGFLALVSVGATAFFDSIAFNELWSEVSPTD